MTNKTTCKEKALPDLLSIDGQVINEGDTVYIEEKGWNYKFIKHTVLSVNKQRRTLILRSKENQEFEATITQYIKENSIRIRVYKDISTAVKQILEEKSKIARNNIERNHLFLKEEKEKIKRYNRMAKIHDFGDTFEI